jgi:hypothetical protein
VAEGHAPLNRKPRMVGEYSVQYGVGEIGNWEVVDDDGEFVRLNLNGGDSAAYWHYKNDFELLHNFKGEDSVKLKEILPEYYRELVDGRKGEQKALKAKLAKENESLSVEGDQLLCFRDKRTSTYWNGTFNPGTKKLDLFPAKNERQCEHFMLSHDQVMGEFIPIWERVFNPRSDEIVNFDNRTINMWAPSEYLKDAKVYKDPTLSKCPLIDRILTSAVGTGVIREHFLNWLAVIIQLRVKPRTAWVLHGTQGCLAPETEIMFRRGNRTGGRPLTIKEAYEKWNGIFQCGTGKGRAWDMSIPTFAHSVKDNLTIGYHEVFKIVESGVKMLYRVVTADGELIRITHEHPFMRPDGSFTKLCDLKVGDLILKKGSPLAHIEQPKGRNKGRVTIHSIPHHPMAWDHWINGKNYKRSHKARLVFEASMNDLTLDEFVAILRKDEAKAKTLRYLPNDVIVHHLDEDCSNDALSNLEVIDKLNHDQHHAKHTGLGTISTRVAKIVSITEDREEMTYDMVMKAPYHNYVANNFCVSNTCKGLLVNKIISPMLGHQYVVTRMQNEMKSDFSAFIEFAMVAFIDEIEVDALEDGGMLESKLKFYITEPTVPIRRMRTDSYSVSSFTGWIFGSNKPQPVVIPRNDRRYNVGQFQKIPLNISLDEVENKLPLEIQAFADYLVSRKADIDVASRPLLTEDRETLMALSETSVDRTANAILTGDLEVMWEAMPNEELIDALHHSSTHAIAAQAYINFIKAATADAYNKRPTKITRDELGMIFMHCVGTAPSSAHKLTQYLKHHNIILKRLRSDGVPSYGLEVTWQVDPGFLKDVYKPPKPQPRARSLRVINGTK